jgi:hypothetical protein
MNKRLLLLNTKKEFIYIMRFFFLFFFYVSEIGLYKGVYSSSGISLG